MPDSAPWLARFVRGDRDVMESVYRMTFTRVRSAAGRVLGEPADRDNVVAQVFLDLCADRELRASFRGGDMAAWLSAVARNRAIDFGRRQKRLVLYDERVEVPDVEEQAEAARRELRRDLERFAATLPDTDRRVLWLRFVEGKTQAAAAADLQMPRSTLEDREKRLKEGLRAFLLGEAQKETSS